MCICVCVCVGGVIYIYSIIRCVKRDYEVIMPEQRPRMPLPDHREISGRVGCTKRRVSVAYRGFFDVWPWAARPDVCFACRVAGYCWDVQHRKEYKKASLFSFFKFDVMRLFFHFFFLSLLTAYQPPQTLDIIILHFATIAAVLVFLCYVTVTRT